MSRYKLIIFDLDDTLFDYKATELQALAFVCSKFDIPFSENVYSIYKQSNYLAKQEINEYILNLDCFREKRVELFLRLIDKTDISIDCFINEYLKASEKGILIDGVSEVLQRLKTIKKVVGTNGSTYPRKNKLVNSQIAQHFVCFYSSEMLGVAKPDARFFLKICADQCVALSDALVVGDSFKTDVLGAHAAGIDSCLISKVNTVHEIPSNSCIIPSIRELIGVLK